MATEPERQLLLIDDRAAETRLLKTAAARAGWRSLCAETLHDAFAIVNRAATRPDAILLRWDDGVAQAAIESLERKGMAPAPILLIASHKEMAAALRAGAADVLIEPVTAERLLMALDGLRQSEAGALRMLTEKISQPIRFDELIGETSVFTDAVAAARRAAAGAGTILIEGEAGVGKQAFASAIHAASGRASQVFAVVNCRTVPRNMIDSELFGHEQGAFPGAFQRRAGQIVQAHGGTLLLDEIDALSLESQGRLVHFLQTGEVRPLGSTAGSLADVRVIAAVDGSLDDIAAGAEFDPALAGMLDARFTIPPLRERRGDIPALAADLIAVIQEEVGTGPGALSMEAAKLLQNLQWPRNVRQLQSVLIRLSAVAEGDILDIGDLGELATLLPRIEANVDRRPAPETVSPIAVFDEKGHLRPLDEIEADIIRLAIERYDGRMSEVARRLGIGRSTLYRKLGELGGASA
ncbi:sigma-54-dependent transcriptional regulator [Sphingomonas sp. ID0503]|uniref:sigma-54-dependent transcriptional regulator n=1 Tax=Sphingomonas sp. ID0503 TaxID=3399691 RepID=UPI003AFA12D2